MDIEELNPFVKWVGSKQQIASAIKAQFPVRFSRYFEPFVGGGSVLLSLGSEFPRIIGDCDSWLIDTYLALRDRCYRVLEILESLPPCREIFDNIRAIHPDSLGPEYRAAHLIYLNQLCFGNIFRLNRQGYFNVPFNNSFHGSVYQVDHLKKVSQKLQGVEIQRCDFGSLPCDARVGDFVYFDPPEWGAGFFGGKESNEQHGFHGLKKHDYHRLYRLCCSLDLRGVAWAVNDANTPMMRLLFSRFYRTPLTFDSRDQEIKSLLFTNYSTAYHESQKNNISVVSSSCSGVSV